MLHPLHPAPLVLAFSLVLLWAPAHAQTTAAAGKDVPASTSGSGAEGQTDQRIERIRIEDKGSRIDELRVGGETQTITVSPKGGMPAYEVAPATANHAPATQGRTGSAASGGTRVWKVLGF